jgi:hypothetical protein
MMTVFNMLTITMFSHLLPYLPVVFTTRTVYKTEDNNKQKFHLPNCFCTHADRQRERHVQLNLVHGTAAAVYMVQLYV